MGITAGQHSPYSIPPLRFVAGQHLRLIPPLPPTSTTRSYFSRFFSMVWPLQNLWQPSLLDNFNLGSPRGHPPAHLLFWGALPLYYDQ